MGNVKKQKKTEYKFVCDKIMALLEETEKKSPKNYFVILNKKKMFFFMYENLNDYNYCIYFNKLIILFFDKIDTVTVKLFEIAKSK